MGSAVPEVVLHYIKRALSLCFHSFSWFEPLAWGNGGWSANWDEDFQCSKKGCQSYKRVLCNRIIRWSNIYGSDKIFCKFHLHRYNYRVMLHFSIIIPPLTKFFFQSKVFKLFFYGGWPLVYMIFSYSSTIAWVLFLISGFQRPLQTCFLLGTLAVHGIITKL